MATTALAPPQPRQTRTMLYLVYFIFFFCGLTQCFESVFLPEFKELFHLNYQHQMYTMFAKNIPFLFSFLVGMYVRKIGYKNCLTIAMGLYAVGTFLLVYGLRVGRYDFVLLAFLLIGTGFTVQLVAGGPLLSALGPDNASSSRLNLGNALGAVAQIIAPFSLSFLIPATISVQGKLPYMQGLFATLGAVLAGVAVGTFLMRGGDTGDSLGETSQPSDIAKLGTVWSHPKVTLGFVAVFLILGTEAGLFGFFRNYLESPAIAGVSSHHSQRLFTVYFALFALGRLLASPIQKRITPSKHMAWHLVAAMVCLAVAIFAKGVVAIISVTAIGFFVSIFFPTLYALAIKDLGDLTGQASGLITLGFLGCALMPVLQGRLADQIGISQSYCLGFFSYLFAMFYVLKGSRMKRLEQGAKE